MTTLREALKVLNEFGLNQTPDEKLSFKHGFNKVRPHNRNETLKHFIVKAMLSYLIQRQGDAFITEYYTQCSEPVGECEAEINDRVFDVVQIKRHEIIVYEVETNKNVKITNGISVREVNLKKVPDDIKGMETYLKQVVV